MAGRSRARAAGGVAVTGTVVTVLLGAVLVPAAAAAAPAPAPPQAAEHGLGALPGHGTLTPAAGLAHLRTDLRAAAVTAPPAAVDLSAWAAPVGDQGRVNSCTTWAIEYAMLGWYANRQGHGGTTFAPMYAYSQMQAKYGWSDAGGYPSDAYAIAQQQGVDTQADYPQGNDDWRTQPTAAQRAAAAPHKTTGSGFLYQSYGSAPGPVARTAISTAVAAGHPVALTMAVYAPFFSLTRGNHVLGLSGATGGLVGHHEVLVVGYDATGVRIQNSWGTGWGDRGFADLTWDYVQSKTVDASAMTGFADGAVPAAPAVSALSPASGPAAGGTVVTVTGTGLTGATGVTVGGRAATGLRVADDGHLTAVVPAGTAGTAPVVVTGPAGSSAARPFTYVAGPTVTAVGPSSGPVAGGTTVVLRGAGLTGATAVTFAGVPGTGLRVLADDTLTVVAPALPAGVAAVQVTAPGGGSRPVAAFTAVAPPRVDSVVTATGRTGTTVTITGAALGPQAVVLFDGVRAAVTGTSASTALRVVAPRHAAGEVTVTVTTPYGTTGTGRFTYTA